MGRPTPRQAFGTAGFARECRAGTFLARSWYGDLDPSDPDRAVSRCYARVYHQGAGERSAKAWECWGEYHDEWARTPDGWRMTNRRFDVTIASGDFDVLQPG